MKSKLPMLLLGMLLGAVGAGLLPRYVAPHLPAALRSTEDDVPGAVVRKQKEDQRLLMTINTSEGAALVTFTDRLEEIDLLIQEGDEVTLALRGFEPFVKDPQIRRVRKPEAAAGALGDASEPPLEAEPDPAMPASEPVTEPGGAELQEWPEEPVESDEPTAGEEPEPERDGAV